MSEENVESTTPKAAEAAAEPVKTIVVACTQQEWAELAKVVGSCPADIVAQAYLWMRSKGPVSVTLNS